MFEHRHTECIIQWEWELTVFGECHKLGRVDHPAGDLQLDSFRFQPLQPGQQSPALRETHHKTLRCHMKFMHCVFRQHSCVLLRFSLLWHQQQPFMCYICATFPRGPFSAVKLLFCFDQVFIFVGDTFLHVCSVMIATSAHSNYPITNFLL